ncbi:MAG TPA: hypothetical protein PKD17_18105, partial [Cellvibrionaceae bacterium]|nr:hypothetical protein [Cellvibrionaceae bacterium]
PLDPFVIAFEAWLRADAGRPEDGLALIAERLPEETPDAAVFQLPLLARGVMRLLTGSRDEGIADVMLVGERELRFGGLTPSAMASAIPLVARAVPSGMRAPRVSWFSCFTPAAEYCARRTLRVDLRCSMVAS